MAFLLPMCFVKFISEIEMLKFYQMWRKQHKNLEVQQWHYLLDGIHNRSIPIYS